MKKLINAFMILSGGFFLLTILGVIDLDNDVAYTPPARVADFNEPTELAAPIPIVVVNPKDNRCPSGGCYFNGTCIPPVSNSTCVSTATDAWKCNAGFLEINGACTNTRPYNGQILTQNYGYLSREGGHEITIKNTGGSSDSLVKIVPVGGRSVIDFYVRKGSSHTVKNIPNGNYDIYFKHYKHSSDGLKSLGAQKMDESVGLYTSYEGGWIYSSTYEVTLYGVIGGDVGTDYVGSDSFDNL